MKYIFVLVFSLSLTACAPSTPPTQTDQCLRQDLFDRCMKNLPAGPEKTMYNDWDEVVSECGHQAYMQSIRKTVLIKEECRGQ